VKKLTILITGGTGNMGRRLTQKLIEKGHEVVVLTLPNDPNSEAAIRQGARVLYGDVSKRETLKGILDGIDTVYHLAAVILSPKDASIFERVNAQGTRNMVELAEKGGVRHFILVSSASVVYDHQNPYSLSKRAAERAVRSSGIPVWTVVRPTLAYEDGGTIEFVRFVEYLRKFPVVPFIGNGASLKRPVFVEDIIQGLSEMAGNGKTHQKTYNLSGGNALSLRQMADLLLIHMGEKRPILPIPLPICRILSLTERVLSKMTHHEPVLSWQTISGVTQDANLDPTEAMNDLGYSPRTFEEGLTQLVSLKNEPGFKEG